MPHRFATVAVAMVLAVVGVLAVAGNASASATPRVSLQDGSGCGDATAHDLGAEVLPPEFSNEESTVILYWKERGGPAASAPDDEISVRVERRRGDSQTWELLAHLETQTQRYRDWVDPGTWFYRVAVINLTKGEVACPLTWTWATVTAPAASVPTHVELAQWCGERGAVHWPWAYVDPVPEDGTSTVTLEWLDDLPHYEGDGWFSDNPVARVARYRIERSTDGVPWTPVATVVNTRTWHGTAPSGEWTYRVALVSVEGQGLVATCDPPLWAEVEVQVPTAAELEETLRQYRILKAEAVRCAVNQTTANLRREARVIVATWVREQMGQIFDDLQACH